MHDARNQYNMPRSQKAQVFQSQNPNTKDAAAAEKSAGRFSKLIAQTKVAVKVKKQHATLL